MPSAISFGTITITDLTDVGTLSVCPTGNLPDSVIYNPDQNTYTPNWANNNLVLTPIIYYGGTQLTAGDLGLTIAWTRQEGASAPTALTTGETVTNGILTVSANKFNTNSTNISYICTITYVEPESSQTLTAEGRLTFSLVKQASAAKTCIITGDSIFTYNGDQTIKGATSITLIGTLNNCSISQWQYQNSSGNWVQYPGSTTALTLTISHTDDTFVNDKCVIRLTTDDNNVYDLHTITKLRDGAAGTNTVAAVLSNENQMIPCDSEGVPQSYDGAYTNIIIYRGGVAETNTWTIATEGTNVTYEVSNDGQSWSSSSTQGSFSYVRITSITADTGRVTFTATKTGENAIVKIFSLVKVESGPAGTTPVIYSLECSTLATNSDISGVFTPSTITLKSYSQTGTNTRTAYSGRFKVLKGSTSTAIYTSTSNEATHTLSSTDIAAAVSEGFMTVVLYQAGGTSTEYDRQTIVITNDGATGAQGPQGNAGEDATNVILGNYADVIPCTSANKTNGQFIITIPFSGYKGTSKVACTVATPPKIFNISAVVTQATASADGTIVYTIPSGTSVSNSTGTISLTFTCNNKTVLGEYRWTRSTAAVDGVNAVMLQLATPYGNVIYNNSGSVTITGYLTDGGTDATSSVTTWQWSKYTGSGYDVISGETSNTITILPADVDGYASYRCVATYDSKTYTQYMSIIDKTDPIQITVFSSIGEQIINGQGTGALYVKVARNDEEVDPIKSERFLTAAPATATEGDYYYHVTPSTKTVVLKKYNGSSWINAPSSDLPTGTYNWTYRDRDGNIVTPTGLATTGKVVYIDASLVSKKITAMVRVQI